MFSKKKKFDYDIEKEKQKRNLKEYNKRQEEIDNKLKKAKQKYNFKSILAKLKFETYTKRLIAVIVFISLVDLQLSYALAFMDKIQIAESLSTQICVTLLGTVLVYSVKAYFETKAEKRDEMIKEGYILPDSKIGTVKSVINNKFNEIINNTELDEHNTNMKMPNETSTIETENPDDNSCG